MTINELIEKLKGFNGNTKIAFSIDEEGNMIHEQAEVSLTLVGEEENEETIAVVYPFGEDVIN